MAIEQAACNPVRGKLAAGYKLMHNSPSKWIFLSDCNRMHREGEYALAPTTACAKCSMRAQRLALQPRHGREAIPWTG
jgi:hypothetical protein